MWYKAAAMCAYFSLSLSLPLQLSFPLSFPLHTISTKSNWKYHMMMSCNISKRILSFVAVAVCRHRDISGAFRFLASTVSEIGFFFSLYASFWFDIILLYILYVLSPNMLCKTLNGLFSFSVSEIYTFCVFFFFRLFSYTPFKFSREQIVECVCLSGKK